MTHGKLQESASGPRIFQGIWPVSRVGAVRDALAGFTLVLSQVFIWDAFGV